MNPPTPTHVTDLLRQREQQFVRIWECESTINSIVGEDYAFPTPPELQSRRATEPVPRHDGGRKKRKSTRRLLRGLRDGIENAYRITFEVSGTEHVSFQDDVAFLRRIMRLQAPEVAVRRVESIAFRSLQDFSVVETLWTGPGSDTSAPTLRAENTTMPGND